VSKGGTVILAMDRCGSTSSSPRLFFPHRCLFSFLFCLLVVSLLLLSARIHKGFFVLGFRGGFLGYFFSTSFGFLLVRFRLAGSSAVCSVGFMSSPRLS